MLFSPFRATPWPLRRSGNISYSMKWKTNLTTRLMIIARNGFWPSWTNFWKSCEKIAKTISKDSRWETSYFPNGSEKSFYRRHRVKLQYHVDEICSVPLLPVFLRKRITCVCCCACHWYSLPEKNREWKRLCSTFRGRCLVTWAGTSGAEGARLKPCKGMMGLLGQPLI